MRNFMWTLPLLAALVLADSVRGEEDVRVELAKLRDEVKQLKADKAAAKPIEGKATAVTDQKYGPDAAVKTKSGRLTLSGLLQVWYHGIQNDHLGPFGDLNKGTAGVLNSGHRGGDTLEGKDNDTFQIRRTELKFTMDITENIQSVVMIDPARITQNFPAANTNLGTRYSAPTVDASALQSSTGDGNRLLQDAYILYHSFIPHHEFQIGQFKPQFGEEGIRSSGQLDFAERTMIGQLGDQRDLGLSVRGFWWDKDRFQYWFGAFNGAGNYLTSAGQFQNRPDDNDQKDMLYRLLVRPLWKQETWGSLEIGGGSEFGTHGESGRYRAVDGATDTDNVDGLDRPKRSAMRHAAWAYYAPGSVMKGFWLRGEWQYIRDTNIPGAVNMNSATSAGTAYSYTQQRPRPMHVWGITGSLGYKLSESIWNDCGMPGWLRPFEFVARYEQFQNIWVSDPAADAAGANLFTSRDRTNVFNTKIVTTGFNYYIKGHNAKIQFNYNWVNEADGGAFLYSRTGTIATTASPNSTTTAFIGHIREVRNDNFILNFQVAW